MNGDRGGRGYDDRDRYDRRRAAAIPPTTAAAPSDGVQDYDRRGDRGRD